MLADHRGALEGTTGAAMLVDDEGRFVAANESCEVVFRRDRDAFVGRTLGELAAEGYFETEVTDHHREALATLSDGGEHASFRTTVIPRESDTGYRYSVRVTAVEDDDGRLGTRWLLRDLGTRHRYEDSVDSLHVATRDLMDADSELQVFNITGSAANGILGFPGVGVRTYDPEEHVLRHVAFGGVVADIDTRPPFDVAGTPHGRAFRTGQTVVDAVPDEDDPYERSVFSHVMYVPIGEYGVLSIGRVGGEFSENDRQFAEILAENAAAALRAVRQRDRLTAQREQLRQQNERLDRFASVVSHDLRNPLAVARAGLERYRESGDESALEDVAYGHRRIGDIVEDVLTLAREDGDVEETEPVRLGPVAEDAWAGVDTDDLSLSVRTDATVAADPGRLRRLLENLFRNSVEHGSTSSRTKSDDSVEHADGATTVRVGDREDPPGFHVADDGPGFPDEDVFEHGFTTAGEGTGFGLAIVGELADAHGWEVAAAESDSGGARVEVTGVDLLD
jgi:signal transduction histidine kinase